MRPVRVTQDSTVRSGTQKVTRVVKEGGRVTRSVRGPRGTRTVVTQNYRPRPFVNLTAPLAAKALADNMEKMPRK